MGPRRRKSHPNLIHFLYMKIQVLEGELVKIEQLECLYFSLLLFSMCYCHAITNEYVIHGQKHSLEVSHTHKCRPQCARHDRSNKQ